MNKFLRLRLVPLGVCLLPLLVAADRQDADVREIRLIRVHLRNGNVLAADAVRETPDSVVVRGPGGEIKLSRAQVLRIERVTVRQAVEPPAHPPAPPAPPAPAASASLPADVEGLLELIRRASDFDRPELQRRLSAAARPVLPALARRLETADGQLRPYVAAALLAVGEPGPVLPLLDSRSPQARAEAARILGLLGFDAAVATLIRRAREDVEPLVRAAAIQALGRLGNAEAFEAVGRACADPAREARGRALEALPALAERHERWDEFDSLLSDAVARTSGEARADVIAAIGVSGRVSLAPLLVEALREDVAALRAAAAIALGRLGARDFAEEILDAFPREEDVAAKLALAEAARMLGLRGGIDFLIRWLDGEDPSVTAVALRALREISGQDFGTDAAAWAAWWDAARPPR